MNTNAPPILWPFATLVRLVAILPLLLIAGCSTYGRMSTPEKAWQGMHAIDTLQTIQIAKHPDCYMENTSAWAIGEHPSTGRVLVFMAAASYLHAKVSYLLDDYGADPTWIRAWDWISLLTKGYTVGHNFSIGLGVTSAKGCTNVH